MKAEKKLELMSEAFQNVKLLAPSLLARLGVSSPMPGESASMQAMKEFLDSWDEKQVGTFFAVLTPAQQAAFAQIMKGLSAEESKKPPNGAS
jgi:hypothetical protein